MSHFGMTVEQAQQYKEHLNTKNYLDVDRSSNAFILRVRTEKNKKGEDVDTIMHVEHLGKRSNLSLMALSHIPVWPRAIESGDYDKAISIN